MNASPLDNPIWHALNSYHDHLVIRGEGIIRYPPDILGAAALPENSRIGFMKLKGLVESNELVGVVGSLPKDLSGWEVVHSDQARQLIGEGLKPATRVDTIVLTSEDVPEMLDLVNVAQPGPFFAACHRVGTISGRTARWTLGSNSGSTASFARVLRSEYSLHTPRLPGTWICRRSYEPGGGVHFRTSGNSLLTYSAWK